MREPVCAAKAGEAASAGRTARAAVTTARRTKRFFKWFPLLVGVTDTDRGGPPARERVNRYAPDGEPDSYERAGAWQRRPVVEGETVFRRLASRC
ncbi:hypothetical protein Ari01nite_07070 [Paractinoplanes rishiriensis]|uniref:Uncharacterized protein n=1 Tax=Paractinoplanes rishiriensis TaxID=1050105 RepID=A0A919JTS0_9ACTN|nr:hypothetical protein Ari01nite_07070 [Actinoplanes rishiriensis]